MLSEGSFHVSTSELTLTRHRLRACRYLQVIQLLPGGLDILGLFVVAAPDLFKSRETQLRSALTAIYRALDKLPQLHDRECDERLIALVDPRTKKYVLLAL